MTRPLGCPVGPPTGRVAIRISWLLALLSAIAVAVSLQPRDAWGQTAEGTVRIRVTSDDGPVATANVAAGTIGSLTNEAGEAVLRLPAGLHEIAASKLGFAESVVEVAVEQGREITVEIELTEQAEAIEGIVVTSTRTERRIEDEPVRVEVLAREEVEEKLLMTPGDIAMMLNETSGLRVQNTSPSLGGANVRIQGLRGRYTQILSDGLPLYGGQSGSLSMLQIPPMDLAQVEVIKGAASALSGSSALGGVIR